MNASILIVDDEKNTREGLSDLLEDNYEITLAANADEAFRLMDAENFDVIITDLRMAGKSGMTIIDKALNSPNKPHCIMITAYGNVETAVEAMRRGAYDFLTKPLNFEKLELVVQRAVNSRKIESENKAMSSRLNQTYNFSKLIGESEALTKSIETAKRVALAKATVLLLGETGTGKELFAQLIHQSSPRANGPFIAVHCAAIAPTLLESEIFGHEKGAYTGANDRRIGRFEAANNGTLFLDEIGEIDLTTQVKLLRFLETHTIERLGSQKQIKLDVRLVCATNRNLEKMVAEGTFREDLFYRLSVVSLILPPLRDRKKDIPILLDYYIKKFATENALPTVKLTKDAQQILTQYPWPGNIRELRNLCENLVVMHSGTTVSELDLDTRFCINQTPASQKPIIANTINSDTDNNANTDAEETPVIIKTKRVKKIQEASGVLSKKETERRLIRNALIKAKGNRTLAADLLGISRRTFHRKLINDPSLTEGFDAKRGRRPDEDSE